MTLITPFPATSAPALTRWLNAPREPNFDAAQASDLNAVTALLDEKNATGETFGACVNDELIGFIGFTPETGMFAGMVLAPEHRGCGHGARFLALAVATLRARGVRTLAAAVRPGNGAIQRTFEAAGAVETARVYTFAEGGN
jgi:RimJ/RimL family protein N-acetyltransferase